MLVSSTLTLGQITFILRAAIQILGFGGLFLIGYIILANSPRTASIKTHDVVNRAVSKSTFTKSSLFWALAALRGKTGDPRTPARLVVAIVLSVMYGAFVSLSDVGFLGFHACEVAGPSSFDRPSSVNTRDQAYNATVNATIAGNKLTSIPAYRCSSSTYTRFGENVTEHVCDSWQNSTYADAEFFSNLNSTDSDVLMPRQLRHYEQSRSQIIDFNTFYMGPGVHRVEQPTVQNGIAVFPHEQGVRAVFGVPILQPQRSVTLDKAMALEIDMGCTKLGIYADTSLDSISGGTDFFATNGSWRSFVGPSYMEDILSKAADDIRDLFRPIFNDSSLDSNGFLYGINASSFQESTAANVMVVYPPIEIDSALDKLDWIKGNCTASLRSRLNLPNDEDSSAVHFCNMLGLGGTILADGGVYVGMSRMVCASATQVNMVSAVISTNTDGSLNPLNFTRLPSDLNHVRADFFDVRSVNNGEDMAYVNYIPYDRFTLSDNPEGQTSHFISQEEDFSSIRTQGTGSGGGSVMIRVGSLMIDDGGHLSGEPATAALGLLKEGNDPIGFNVSLVPKWGGELGASYIINSLAYTGWAAENRPAFVVRSTGGKLATCYIPPYALGFLPLIVAAIFVAVWVLFLFLTSRIVGMKNLEYLYGGMTPFWGVISPHTTAQDTILGWENNPKPHLQLLVQGQPLLAGDETAARYIHSGSPVEKY
ncbi:hypothetical protein D9758_015415 [Tetrapyrgos nigripes]|uniref:Uncharacterized protein n=1 Tax=Tetrapyrgos nigripes TaxID=182062 RepID=A0A8H5CJJ4_9AGAR|nr:hypothetical protein D9758_015415 [Tetrapyrgos nigripes]